MSLADRLLKRTTKISGCWLWKGATNDKGYGQIKVNGKTTYVHRASYEFHVGPIPEGAVLDHICRVPSCLNPAHLDAVTQKENIRRGRLPGLLELQKQKKFCPSGHEYSDTNTYLNHRGSRNCKVCAKARAVEWNRKNRTKKRKS